MSALRLHLLGSPLIELDGSPVSVDTRKAVALLAYLAVTGERHGRDALAALFWSELDQQRARASLRRTLSSLNTALAGEWLDADRESIALNSGGQRPAVGGQPPFWLDVAHFRQLLASRRSHRHPAAEVCPTCRAALDEAAELYRDDFLAGFTLRDAPAFDEWQFFQAEALRRELAGALEKLAQYYGRLGQWEAAIAHARRLLALDPLQEASHRLLMQLYAWSGQRSAALRQYRECARILNQELGVEPLAETTTLYEHILKDDKVTRWQGDKVTSVDAVTLSPPNPLTLSPLPLVGRDAEWSALLEAYQAVGPDGRLIVLEGEAGIGKTRLAETFLATARQRGAVVIAGRCYAGESGLAYGPLAEALRTALGSVGETILSDSDDKPYWFGELARLLPEVAQRRSDLPPPPPLDSPGAQSRFFEALRQLLLYLGQPPAASEPARDLAPCVFFLDDLQWSDAATLDWLTYLVRRLRDYPLCVLVTWRSVTGTTENRPNQLLAEARRAGRATHICLERLSQADVIDLLKAADVTMTPEVTGEQLYRESEGLPYFVVEYLAALPAGDTPTAWPVPRGARDLLAARLAGISEMGQQILTTAAALGRSFDFDTVRAASGRSEEEAVAALEELLARHLIAETPSSFIPHPSSLNYDFTHEKLRALVYEETSLARRRLLHRRVAEALATRSQGRPAAASHIAYHYRLAGQNEAAATYFRQAGDYARSLYANREALEHFQTALALGERESDHKQVELHLASGDLQTILGEYNAARQSIEAALALLPQPDTASEESAAETQAYAKHRLGLIYHRLGQWPLAESHFEAAVAALETNEAAASATVTLPPNHLVTLSSLYADWSLTAYQQGDKDRALALAHHALSLAEAVSEPRALAQAHNILGILAKNRADLKQARYHLEQSLSLAEAMADLWAQVPALNNLALVHAAGGDYQQAMALIEKALALCRSLGDRHRQAALHNNLADLLHAAGRHEEAMDHLKQAVTIFAEIGAATGEWQPEIWKLVEW